MSRKYHTTEHTDISNIPEEEYYREAADKIWELAKEYENDKVWELAQTLKALATELHDVARSRTNQTSDEK